MLILFETPAGYAIFKLLDEKKLQQTENLYKDFESPEAASKIVKLKHFEKFHDTTDALAAVTAAVEGKMSKSLKKLLKKLYAKEAHEELAVADAKLGNAIKEKLNLSCVFNNTVAELMRCIRSQVDNLISGLGPREMSAMTLGLAHSLSRYKLKFSPDKVDTMIVQAISLLDDLDKELNNYIMRCREWYGWHFPELGKIISDNLAFVKTVICMGMRTNAKITDLSEILPEDLEQNVKEAAEISMGTEISDEDIENIKYLCEQVVDITSYRSQLYQYLQNRMMAIAPNVTVLAGELVGARLISHAGSLLNLAKHPSSTVQILGAEKALFRALKTKHDTPKYGLIYHTSLVGQTNQKIKGKISRMLAAKIALASRVDALGETIDCELGIEHKAKLERRLAQLEQNGLQRISGTGKTKRQWDKYDNKSQIQRYNIGDDSTLPRFSGKRKFEEHQDMEPETKKIKVESVEIKTEPEVTESGKKKKKKKNRSFPTEDEGQQPQVEMPEVEPAQELSESGKKKKKKKHIFSAESEVVTQEIDSGKIKSEIEESVAYEFSQELSPKKKKKKKKKQHSDE